jgi:hypothetical protein
MQRLHASTARIATGGRNTLPSDSFDLCTMMRSAAGRGRARIEANFQVVGQPGWPARFHGQFLDTGAPSPGEGSATFATQVFTTPSSWDFVHWRLRVRSADPHFASGPWLSPQGNSLFGTDLRQLPLTAEVIEPWPVTADDELSASIAPNPVSTTARIAFSLPHAGHAELDIVDVQGRRVASLANGELEAAASAYTWDTRDAGGVPVPSGVYFVRLTIGSARATGKIIIRR